MKENTVNISLKRYNELRDLETDIKENKTWIIDSHYVYSAYGVHTDDMKVKVMSTDEAVTEIAKKAVDKKVENEKLKEQLRSKEEQLRNLRTDHRLDIIEIKKMSIFKFLRYRNR